MQLATTPVRHDLSLTADGQSPVLEFKKRYLTLEQVIAAMPGEITKQTFHRWRRECYFPEADLYLGKSPLWDEAIVQLWLLDKAAEEARRQKLSGKQWVPSALSVAADGTVTLKK